MSLAVAVSGGVDSLLALDLLRRKRTVFGLYAFFLPKNQSQQRISREIEKFCHSLNVEFKTVDLSSEFRRLIIDRFIQDYLQGLTPNPCALCNKWIKFGLLLDKARELGADFIATGHYAKTGLDSKNRPYLSRGEDRQKDQSYFLSLLSLDQLDRTVLPLGSWKKKEVYQIVRKSSWSVPSKTESQEICFIPNNDYRSFLEAHRKNLPGPGPIIDSSGQKLGQHQGLYRYTIGQRRGLRIAYSQPLYVLAKDRGNNSLIVGPKSELSSSHCLVGQLNFLLPFRQWPDQVFVQTVYRQHPKPSQVRLKDQKLEVLFENRQKPATPGQVAAVYNQEGRVLGAGLIED